MRALSPHARFSLQLIEAPVKRGLDTQGNVVEYADTKPVIANFGQSGLTDEEQLAALEHFSFSGLPDGVNPLSTVSVWDSEAQAIANGWDEKFTAKVDERLRFLATQNPASVCVVEPERKAPPWPTYDLAETAEEIFGLMQITGIDPATVRLYEVENKNRPDIWSVLEKLQSGETTLEEVLAPQQTAQPPSIQAGSMEQFIATNVGNTALGEGGVFPDTPAPAQPTTLPLGPADVFPVMTSPGRWTLSNGSVVQGKKVAAIEAEEALKVTPEEVIVNA